MAGEGGEQGGGEGLDAGVCGELGICMFKAAVAAFSTRTAVGMCESMSIESTGVSKLPDVALAASAVGGVIVFTFLALLCVVRKALTEGW